MQGNGLDLSLFQFDYDMSFAVFFLNADRTIYGRYGTRSKKPKEADSDISLEGLAAAMEAVLSLHEDYPANRASLAAKTGPKPLFPVPEKMPALAETGRFRSELAEGDKKTISQSCIHCHQIRDAERSHYFSNRKPLPPEVMYPWPMPEVIGLELDRTKAATVKSVKPGSLADIRGFKAGDVLIQLNGQDPVSIADVQWILHRAGEEGTLAVVVLRGGAQTVGFTLRLPSGWREASDISWRTSSWFLRAVATGGLVLESLPAEDRRRRKLEDDQMALLVTHVGQYNKHAAAKRAGFQKDDLIISYDGITDPWRETDLFAHVLYKKKTGDRVPVTVLRGDRKVDLTLPVQD